MDKNLYKNDLETRESTWTFSETTSGDMILVEFKDGSTVMHEAFKMEVVDAYKNIRFDYLDGENPPFISTTTQRDALTSIATSTVICNTTNDRLEFYNGTDWIGQALDIGCKLTKSADQSISDSTVTVITWDQEVYDGTDMHDNSTNNSRITIAEAGIYLVTSQTAWATGSTGRRDIRIRKDGTTVIGHDRVAGDSFSYNASSWVFKFAASDYIELLVRQTNGSSLDFTASDSSLDATFFAIQKIA